MPTPLPTQVAVATATALSGPGDDLLFWLNVALVVVTACYVVLTYNISKSSDAAAKAAARSADAAQEQTQLSARPCLIDAGPITLGKVSAESQQRQSLPLNLTLKIENAGLGPAIGATADVTVHGLRFDISSSSKSSFQQGSTIRAGAGEGVAISARPPASTDAPVGDDVVDGLIGVEYEDAFGQRWRTEWVISVPTRGVKDGRIVKRTVISLDAPRSSAT